MPLTLEATGVLSPFVRFTGSPYHWDLVGDVYINPASVFYITPAGSDLEATFIQFGDEIGNPSKPARVTVDSLLSEVTAAFASLGFVSVGQVLIVPSHVSAIQERTSASTTDVYFHGGPILQLTEPASDVVNILAGIYRSAIAFPRLGALTLSATSTIS